MLVSKYCFWGSPTFKETKYKIIKMYVAQLFGWEYVIIDFNENGISHVLVILVERVPVVPMT